MKMPVDTTALSKEVVAPIPVRRRRFHQINPSVALAAMVHLVTRTPSIRHLTGTPIPLAQEMRNFVQERSRTSSFKSALFCLRGGRAVSILFLPSQFHFALSVCLLSFLLSFFFSHDRSQYRAKWGEGNLLERRVVVIWLQFGGFWVLDRIWNWESRTCTMEWVSLLLAFQLLIEDL